MKEKSKKTAKNAPKFREYEIGGRKFVQRPLVLGQLDQILNLLAGIKFPNVSDIRAVVAILAGEDLMARALAIVLCEADKGPRDKDLEALTEFMKENADLVTTLAVVEDFFDLTRPESVFGKLAEMGIALQAKMEAEGLTSLSALSPPATSPRGTKSSGATPTKGSNPT